MKRVLSFVLAMSLATPALAAPKADDTAELR
jgi:hypothetical protein